MPLDFYRPARFAKPDALHHESLWLTERLSDLDQWTAASAR
jgi:hypothetical protein